MTDKVFFDIERKADKIGYKIRHESPINPLLNYAEMQRRKNDHLRKINNNELEPMAVLGPVEIMQIKYKYGIDVMNLKGADHKALAYILETEYPKLKTTNRKLHRKGAGGRGTKYHGALKAGT